MKCCELSVMEGFQGRQGPDVCRKPFCWFSGVSIRWALSNLKNSLKSGGRWIVTINNSPHQFNCFQTFVRCLGEPVWLIVWLLKKRWYFKSSSLYSWKIELVHKSIIPKQNRHVNKTCRLFICLSMIFIFTFFNCIGIISVWAKMAGKGRTAVNNVILRCYKSWI